MDSVKARSFVALGAMSATFRVVTFGALELERPAAVVVAAALPP